MKNLKKPKRGRKTITDKKKMVTIYVRESLIIHHGGLEELKEKLIAQCLKDQIC